MASDSSRSGSLSSRQGADSSAPTVVDATFTSKEQGPLEAAQKSEFPEGGRDAWLAVLGGFLVQYASFGYINAFGVYQDYYIRHYLTKSTPSEIGWIGGTQIFLNFSCGVFVGRLFDRGQLRKLLIAGTIVHALALFTLSLSHKGAFYQVFLTNGVALGLSSGLTYIPSLGIVSHYFVQKRPLAMGIVSSGSALGAVLHPIMLNHLLDTSLGFHNTVRVSGSLNVFLLLVATLIIRPRLQPRPAQHFPIIQWLKEPAYFVCLLSSFVVFLGLFYPVFYIQLLANFRGVDPNLAFYAVSIMNAASFFGRILPAGFAPHLGAMNMQTVFCIAAGVTACFMYLLWSNAAFIIFAIIYGFTTGAAIALTPSMFATLSKDMNELGTRVGLNFALSGILGLFSTPITGAILTDRYHWKNASLFSGIALMLAGILVFVSRTFHTKVVGTWKV